MPSQPDALESDRHAVRRFLAYVLDYKTLLAVTIGCGFAKFGLNYTFPWLIGTAVDRAMTPHDGVSTASRMHWAEWLAAGGILLSIGHGFASYFRGYLAAKLGSRVIRDLRQDLFDHLHRLSLAFYAKERTGSIVSRIISDIQTASQLVNGGLINTAMDCASIVGGLWLIYSINVKLATATLVILPLYWLMFRSLNPKVKNASLRVQSQISKISGNVQERMAGIALIKTYATEKRESERFRDDTEEHYERVLKQSNISQMVSACSETLVHFGQTIVIGYGGYLAIYGTKVVDGQTVPELTAGEVVKFMGYLAVMYLPVRRFAEINVVWQTSLAAIERVFEVFDITPKITEKADAPKTQPTHGEVRFEHVTFDYQDDSDEARTSLEEGDGVADNTAPSRPILDDIDLVIAPGERVALVGPSGSGKTTLASLLPRLYDVKAGRIVIDGLDVRDYKLKCLRKGIGIVQQDSLLFTGTIGENIAYGRPNATAEQIVNAAKAANAHEFIKELPDGYDSRIGERGVNVSGGQRQRLSIARAILKDPRILILDEATSALDSQSEHLVQQALKRLMRGRTCLIIAHRLSTVRHADRIVVMEHGRVQDVGNHIDLLARDGLYARLVRQQFGHTETLKSA